MWLSHIIGNLGENFKDIAGKSCSWDALRYIFGHGHRSGFFRPFVRLTLFPRNIMHTLNLTYTAPLPEVLRTEAGQLIANAEDWQTLRRPEVLKLCQTYLYGPFPGSRDVSVDLTETGTLTMAGIALVREQYRLTTVGLPIDLVVYRPAEATGPVPCLFSYNYKGNPTIAHDPKLTGRCYGDFKPGSRTHLHNIPAICGSGFAFATACYQDIENDANALNQPDTTWDTGVRKALEDELPHTQWGCIGAWAWGESRIMDALALIPAIDPRKVFFSGLSRHGKATLWAAANDLRIAGAISNGSCAAGASLVRHVDRGTETLTDITRFRSWFAPAYYTFAGHENDFPIDQHFLLSLVAPRPLLIADSADDLWADPQGEFLGLREACPVYGLYGLGGLENAPYPKPYGYVWGGNVGFQLRTGDHSSTPFEWYGYIQFLKRCLAGQTDVTARNLWD